MPKSRKFTKEFMQSLNAFTHAPEAQWLQLQYRDELAKTWRITEGMRLLEIGCGQGDMTMVLANAVGPSGSIVAVDAAGPEYGSPTTLGRSIAMIQNSPIGDRIDFRLNFDAANAEFDEAFDAVVISHSSWYFASLGDLEHVLARAAGWAVRLFFAEWDLEPTDLSQTPHLMAAMLQGGLCALEPHPELNARTPFPRRVLEDMLERTGWRVSFIEQVESRGLDDGIWEVANCLNAIEKVTADGAYPDHLRSMGAALRQASEKGHVTTLPSYVILAKNVANPSLKIR